MNSLELRASKAQTDARGASARVVERLGVHNISLLVALAILIIIFGSLRGDVFFSSRNLLNIGLGVTILGVLAMSQTVVIVAGGLDIAVGATVGLTTVSTAMAIQATGSPAAGIVAGLLLGGLAGLVNGIIITYGRVNAVIATLGTMTMDAATAAIDQGKQDLPAGDGANLSLKDRIARDLGQRILAGTYAQHVVLPTEAELCVIYGASRTALRDALLTLSAKGLIEARKRAGTRVRASSEWNRLDAQVLEWMRDIEPDLDFVRGLIEARLVIEPAAAQLAARMATSGDLAVIEAAYEAMVQPAASAAAALRVIIASGKFQGVMAAQTPIGCFNTMKRRSRPADGMTSP